MQWRLLRLPLSAAIGYLAAFPICHSVRGPNAVMADEIGDFFMPWNEEFYIILFIKFYNTIFFLLVVASGGTLFAFALTRAILGFLLSSFATLTLCSFAAIAIGSVFDFGDAGRSVTSCLLLMAPAAWHTWIVNRAWRDPQARLLIFRMLWRPIIGGISLLSLYVFWNQEYGKLSGALHPSPTGLLEREFVFSLLFFLYFFFCFSFFMAAYRRVVRVTNGGVSAGWILFVPTLLILFVSTFQLFFEVIYDFFYFDIKYKYRFDADEETVFFMAISILGTLMGSLWGVMVWVTKRPWRAASYLVASKRLAEVLDSQGFGKASGRFSRAAVLGPPQGNDKG